MRVPNERPHKVSDSKTPTLFSPLVRFSCSCLFYRYSYLSSHHFYVALTQTLKHTTTSTAMGRSARGSGSGFTRRSSMGTSRPSSSASSSASRQQQSHQPQQQPQHNITVVRPVGSPMGGGSFLGNMAASATGAVLGHSIANSLFGHHGQQSQPVEQQPVQQQLPQQPPQVPMSQLSEAQQAEHGGPCAPQMNTFMRCVEGNNGESGDCKWAWEQYSQCKQAQGGTIPKF